MNSIYGISYECTPIFSEINGEIIKTGYRAGEFYNPINATIITALVRNLITETCLEIENNGGEVLLIMTDSIFWNGKIDNINKDKWKEQKTLGYFEKPIEVKKFMCLGAGRYEYYAMNKQGKFEKYKGKTRGINITDLLSENGVIMNKFNWRSLVHKASILKTHILDVNTRILISPPIVLNYKKYSVKDLGLVKTEKREIDILAGKSKRMMYLYEGWLDDITKKMIDTDPLYLFEGFKGVEGLLDFTLPHYRKLVMQNILIEKGVKLQMQRKEQNERYLKKNGDKKKEDTRSKYALLKKYGCDRDTCRKYSNRKWNVVYDYISKIEYGRKTKNENTNAKI